MSPGASDAFVTLSADNNALLFMIVPEATSAWDSKFLLSNYMQNRLSDCLPVTTTSCVSPSSWQRR